MGIHIRATSLQAWSKRARAHTHQRAYAPLGNTGKTWEDKRVSLGWWTTGCGDRCPELISCQPGPLPVPELRVSSSQEPTSPARTSTRRFLFPGEELFCLSHFKGGFHASNFGEVLHVSPSDRELEPHARSLVGASPRGWRMQTFVDLRASSYLCSWGENDFWVSSTGWVTLAWSPPLQEPVAIYKTRV